MNGAAWELIPPCELCGDKHDPLNRIGCRELVVKQRDALRTACEAWLQLLNEMPPEVEVPVAVGLKIIELRDYTRTALGECPPKGG